MVERLFTRDTDGNCKCNVTNLINEKDSICENLPRLAEQGFLPTINENFEGFEPPTRSETTRHGLKTRRNSHPLTVRERLTKSTFRTRKFDDNAIKCKQSEAKCRKCLSRDPMLSVKMPPKQDNITFDKHKLDKIDEADTTTEFEEDTDCETGTTNQHIVDASRYSMNMASRRGSYPVDSRVCMQRNFREYTQCREDIVSKWMKVERRA